MKERNEKQHRHIDSENETNEILFLFLFISNIRIYDTRLYRTIVIICCIGLRYTFNGSEVVISFSKWNTFDSF